MDSQRMNGSRICTGIAKHLKIILTKCFLFYPCNRESLVVNKVIMFLLSVVLGWLFYEVILIELDFSPVLSLSLGIVTTLLLGLGNVLSKQIRCVTLLIVPSFCTRGGKNILRTMIFIHLIAGPVQNFIYNAREIVRTFACSGYHKNNLSKTNYELISQPFQDALLNMKLNMESIADGVKSINNVLKPLKEEIEGDDEIKIIKYENDYEDELFQQRKYRSEEIEEKYKIDNETNINDPAKAIESKYYKKLEYRCQNLITKAEASCRDVFKNSYNQCHKNISMSVAWLVCLPMKLSSVCNVFSVFDNEKICDPREDISGGFGRSYIILNNTEEYFRNEFMDSHFEIKLKKPELLMNYKNVKEAAYEMIHEVEERSEFFEVFCQYIKIFLALNVVRLLYISQKYHDKYLNDIRFDNMYITTYFVHIDERRKLNGHYSLIPFRKDELEKLTYPRSIFLTKIERNFVIIKVIKLIIQVILGCLLFVADWSLYTMMLMIKKQGLIEYTQTGPHDVEVTIKGSGLISRILRSLLNGFNFKKKVNVILSNKACLPNPRALRKQYIYKICGLYLFTVFITIFQCYIKRIFRVICKFFYRKREKRRVLHLYNSYLRQRYNFFKNIKYEIYIMYRNDKIELENNIWLIMREYFPPWFGWLKIFPFARYHCVICKDTEPRRGFPVTCKNSDCPVTYCSCCWKEIEQYCYICDTDCLGGTEENKALCYYKSYESINCAKDHISLLE